MLQCAYASRTHCISTFGPADSCIHVGYIDRAALVFNLKQHIPIRVRCKSVLQAVPSVREPNFEVNRTKAELTTCYAASLFCTFAPSCCFAQFISCVSAESRLTWDLRKVQVRQPHGSTGFKDPSRAASTRFGYAEYVDRPNVDTSAAAVRPASGARCFLLCGCRGVFA